jgi:phenylalanyl-tRNA synthetase alpha chain
VIRQILAALFEDETIEMRMRPGYFPFVEPGFEIDARPSGSDKWIEILGAGIIHPRVLEQADVDTNEWSGFAFGLGLTRMVAIKHGLKDIRLLTNGDLRFAKS